MRLMLALLRILCHSSKSNPMYVNLLLGGLVHLNQVCRLLVFVNLFVLSSAAQRTDSASIAIVARQTFVMTKPPVHVPSGTVVDGPILGNGDVGVALAGPPERQQFYIGKNDFWSQQASPMTVGSMELTMPDLGGATYREEEDLLHAEVRGTFKKANTTVETTAWVAATKNLFVTKLQAHGAGSVEVHASLFPPGTAITHNDKPVNIGREEGGQGRWYFNGLIDEVHLYDRALDQADVAQLVNLQDPAKGLIRRWGFDALEGTTPQDTVAKLVTGPACPGPPSIHRPGERPVDEPGCKPDGYHLDYQPYGVGKRGRAVKLMHAWSYIDAGQVAPLQQVTIAAWIYIFSAGDANYILSKGDWNEAYTLCLDQGRLRFNVGEQFVRSKDALPTHQWVHVAGTFDGSILRAYVDGQEVLPRARFLISGNTSDTVWMTRNADGPLDEQYAWPNPIGSTTTVTTKGREVSVAARLVGEQGSIRNGSIDFMLKPGQPVYLVGLILSDLDAPNHLATAQSRAQEITIAEIERVGQAHREWWKEYWSQSFVEIGDPVLEKFYYASQYITASASRTGKVAPGLYGPWVTTDHPSWNGDYTLDYNHQTPYLGLYSSNHVATADPYDPPVLEFVNRGKTYARTMLNVRGVYYPGHIGPWGLEREFDYDPFMGMKSNAAFLAMPMLMRFYSTYDDSYAAKVYPFLREVGDFWEDYLVKSQGQYIISNDCADEVGPWNSRPDWTKCAASLNPMNELAFVRATFKGLIDMSHELGLDASRRPAWQEIIDHLSPYPTGERHGKKVLVIAEAGDDGKSTSTIASWGTLAIWPGSQIGLGEDSKLLQLALDTVIERGYREHPLVPPAMARVGYDPVKLLAAMQKDCLANGYPNGYIFFPGGGVESASSIPATINEMMLQSFTGVLRLFPVWPKDRGASFGNLRAYGAFLVSSTFRDGRVYALSLLSEKGRDCVLANPWPGQSVVLYRNGQKAETLNGDRIKFSTTRDESISIRPL
jgi:alpha-L-fucosidase 2